ncbi:MAG TPA: redoxin domain-containing protein [Planctomycetota bacterium]|jgi:peroxiredoxin
MKHTCVLWLGVILAFLTGCQTPERRTALQRMDRLQAENTALKAKAESESAQARMDAAQRQQDALRMMEALGHRIDDLSRKVDTVQSSDVKPAPKPAPEPVPAPNKPAETAAPAPPPPVAGRDARPTAANEELERIKTETREELARMQEQLARAQVQAETAAKAVETVDKAGDNKGVPSWKGKALPLTKFLDSSGKLVDIASFKGKKIVVLTIMKGFYSGGVCVYCTRQTVGLARAAEQFREAQAEVLVMYPGSEQHIPDFIRSCRDYEKSDDPRFRLPFKLLLDVNQDVVRSLGIVSDLALPATFVLDKDGVVRFEYIGRTLSDRPNAETVLQEVKKIGAGQP